MVKFDLNSFFVMRKFRWFGFSITCDIINAGWICNATLKKSVFKILAFTFLYEIGYFSAKTAGGATICTNLNSTYTRMLCVQKLKILFGQFREEDV